MRTWSPIVPRRSPPVRRQAVTDHREFLDQVDAVYVCTPPTAHREQVTAAVATGRHVFCEKPLATTLEDSRAIVEAVSSGGSHVMLGFNNHFRAPVRRLVSCF